MYIRRSLYYNNSDLFDCEVDMALNIFLPERLAGESHKEFAYRVIHKNIIDLTLAPESILNESEIAAALGSSRTPVHEALKLLAEEFLVDIVPSKESRVSRIDYRQMVESLFLRCSIEPPLIDSLKGQLSSENMQKLLLNVEAQKEAFAAGALDRYYDLDDAFHRLIFQFANRLNTYGLLQKMLNQFARFRNLVYRHRDCSAILQKSLEEHLQLFYSLAISRRLPVSSQEFIRAHITRSMGDMPFIYEQFPGYFCGYDPQRGPADPKDLMKISLL